jgi:hypothetical protein
MDLAFSVRLIIEPQSRSYSTTSIQEKAGILKKGSVDD